MTRKKLANYIAGYVGIIVLLISVFGMLKGGGFSEHFIGLFCGICLMGTSIVHGEPDKFTCDQKTDL